VLADAKDYFKNVQTKDTHYIPFITDKDPAPIYLNKEIMERYRPEMKKYYYDPVKYKTYLDQLGITYPTWKRNKKYSYSFFKQCNPPDERPGSRTILERGMQQPGQPWQGQALIFTETT
jgi:hypothetical protein